MKKSLLIIFSAISFLNYAQEDNVDYELRNDEKMGYIINKAGNKVEGIVRLNGDAQNPWNNQKKVKFIASTNIDKAKKKQKFTTYDPDELKGYMAYDGDVERVFESVKYTNFKEGNNTATGGLSGALKTFNNVTKSEQFAELIEDGKIKVYKIYGYPTTFSAGSQIQEAEKETKRLRDFPGYIYSKRGSKPKELNHAEIKTIIGDCSVVKTKFDKGEYASAKAGNEKKSAIGRFIKNEIDNAKSNVPQMVDEIIVDYNNSCK